MAGMRRWPAGNETIFLACFLAGILGGTIAGNMILPAGGISAGTAAGSMERFLYICRQRVGEGTAGFLLGMTVCAAPCFWLLAVYLGLSVAWIIVRYTAALGMMGLPGFFLSCFPQWICYLPAWCLLIWRGLKGPSRLRLLPPAMILTLLCLGAGAEAYINPMVMRCLVR